jgi:polysaccharide pyruvyl transferase WcaK-like protein
VRGEWPPGRPRVLVADAWLANAGDGAIALATEARLRRLAPEAAVLHAAYQGDLLGEAYPQLALAPPLDGLLGVVEVPEMNGYGRDRGDALLAAADAILSQGGGFTMEHYGPWQRLRTWELVAERGIPLAFCAQSIGPWRAARERAMLTRAFRAAVAVGVREAASAANVVELGVDPERIVHGGDEAFSLFEDPPPDAAPRGLAAVLTAHPSVEAGGTVATSQLDRTAAIAERLADLAGGEGLMLLSTQQGLGGLDRGLEDDSEVAAEVLERLPAPAARCVEAVEGYVSPLAFADAVAGRRALLTMRMHPAILAMCRGVPAVAIDPGFKTLGVLAEAGVGDSIIQAGGPDEIAARVAAAAAPEAPRGAVLWARLDGARRRAAVNDEVVQRLLAAASERCA